MRPVRATALYIAWSFKAFALTGRQVTAPNNPGRCPGLRASALTGRAAKNLLLPFTFALPFGQRFSIPLRVGDRWFRACGAYLRNLNP